jgi:heterodisulfide reductase subunit A-like polyferredoxin
MSDEEIIEEVGTIIVATGLTPYDPTELDEYGYTRFGNVLTSLEFERLVNASGPTKGELIGQLTVTTRNQSVSFSVLGPVPPAKVPCTAPISAA